jgi:hypothetical protein
MKKKLDTSQVANELTGASLFFTSPARVAEPGAPAAPTPEQVQTDRSPSRSDDQETGFPGNQETSQPTSQPGNQETRKPAFPMAPTALSFDINAQPLYKATFLFTQDELEAMEDLKLELRRVFDMKITKNDLARCAAQHLIEDYRLKGKESALIRRLNHKRNR